MCMIYQDVKATKYYHQIKRLGPQMKNIEEKEERHDIVKRLSNTKDIRNNKNNPILTVE